MDVRTVVEVRVGCKPFFDRVDAASNPADGLSGERLQGPWTVEPIQLPSALWDERVVVPASNHQVLTHSGGHQKVDTTAWPSVLTPHGQAQNEEGL